MVGRRLYQGSTTLQSYDDHGVTPLGLQDAVQHFMHTCDHVTKRFREWDEGGSLFLTVIVKKMTL